MMDEYYGNEEFYDEINRTENNIWPPSAIFFQSSSTFIINTDIENNIKSNLKNLYYLCPYCHEFPIINILNEKEMLIKCCEKNNYKKMFISDYIEKLKLNHSNFQEKYLKCKDCGKDNNYYYCQNCKKNICYKCKIKHNTHNLKVYNEIKKIKNIEYLYEKITRKKIEEIYIKKKRHKTR